MFGAYAYFHLGGRCERGEEEGDTEDAKDAEEEGEFVFCGSLLQKNLHYQSAFGGTMSFSFISLRAFLALR